MASYIPSATDSTRPFDSDDPSVGAAEFRALKARVNQLAGSSSLPVSATINQSSLTCLLYPSANGFWQDIYKGGWKPAFMNQQWGASTVGFCITDANTDTPIQFESCATQVNIGVVTAPVNSAASNAIVGVRMAVGATKAIQAIWLKLGKTGNPLGAINLSIVIDGSNNPSGIVPIANGTATGIGCQVGIPATSNWVRFVFPVPPTLSVGSNYWILITGTAAANASNFVSWAAQNATVTNHPRAKNITNGTAAGVFTANGSLVTNYIVETAASSQFFLPSQGQFDSALKFSQPAGTNSLDFSDVITKPMSEFFDGVEFTALHRISGAVKGKPIADYICGIDNNRITLQCPLGTGAAQVTIYTDSGAVSSILGITDVTTTNMTDIAIHARLAGDGSDYIQLWINGVKEAETTLQTYNMSPRFKLFGTCWLGGGFPLAPAWTNTLTMASLPSANGYNWNGSATEGSAMIVGAGKLHQNAAGYGSTQDGYYSKPAVGFNNATGSTIRAKVQMRGYATNTLNVGNDAGAVELILADGTNVCNLHINGYYLALGKAATTALYAQVDMTTHPREIIVVLQSTSMYVYVDGQLVIAGTSLNSLPLALNEIRFGDTSTVTGESADVSWGDISYYTGGALTPQVATNMRLHEYGFWSKDRTSLLSTLWNSGVPQSIKSLTGIARNYVTPVEFEEIKRGMLATINPPVGAPVPTGTEENTFILGNIFELQLKSQIQDSIAAADNIFSAFVTDGIASRTNTLSAQAGFYGILNTGNERISTYDGMHYMTIAYSTALNNIQLLLPKEFYVRSKN